MKSFAVAASLCALAPAAAFVPGVPALAGVRSSPSKLSMSTERSVSIPFDPKPEGLDGNMVGDVGFDPAGFSNNPPAWVSGEGSDTAARVKWYREAELAHGRVAMLAAAGWIFPEIYHFPGNNVLGADRFAEMNPLLAYDKIPTAGSIQIIVTLLILETIRLNRSIRTNDGPPGDILLGQGDGRWNPFNFNYTPEEYAEKQLQVSQSVRPSVIWGSKASNARMWHIHILISLLHNVTFSGRRMRRCGLDRAMLSFSPSIAAYIGCLFGGRHFFLHAHVPNRREAAVGKPSRNWCSRQLPVY